MSRILHNFDAWANSGMKGALFGIESFHQEILKQMHKNEKVQAAFELAERFNRAGLYAHGYYIIGLPSETPESIDADLRTLASLELDVTQITIDTPHPQTEMWRDLESNYGVFENGPSSTLSISALPAFSKPFSNAASTIATALVGCAAR